MAGEEKTRSELIDELRELRRKVALLEGERDAGAEEQAESLAANLRELDALYSEAPVGLCLMDRELRFQRINERLARINGVSVKGHIGARIRDVVPHLADQIVPVYERILRTGEAVVDLELRGEPPSDPGVEHIWLANHRPVTRPDGFITGIVTVVQDITEAKRTEEKLGRIREHLAEAQRIADFGSWEWHLLDDHVWWSDQLYRILVREPGSITPTFDGIIELVYPEDRGIVREQIEATLKRDEPFVVEARMEAGDGSIRLMEANASLKRTREGVPMILTGTVRDITRQRGKKARER